MYKGLPVITNQISAEEQRGIPHHLLAHIDPLDPTWTNGLFVREAQRLIKEIRSRGKLPIVVGGTHYYVHALLFEGSSLIESDATAAAGVETPEEKKIRFRSQEETRSQFPILEEPTPVILAKLREVDPVMAERWHPDDRRKIKRSLEICLTTGRKTSEIYAEQREAKLAMATSEAKESWETLVFWTYSETERLRERLRRRVDKMVQNGLMEEVRTLHRRLRERTERGEVVDRTRGIWQSIGFRQMEPFLDGELELELDVKLEDNGSENENENNGNNEKLREVLQKKKEAGLEQINDATRQYARYQLRWIRQKTLKAFKEHEALGSLYLLDSTDAERFAGNVLGPAADICRQYLDGEQRPLPAEISDTAREMMEAFANECEKKEGKVVFRVKRCDVCDMSLVTEDEWVKHVNGRKHKRILRGKKRTALVPVEDGGRSDDGQDRGDRGVVIEVPQVDGQSSI